MLDTAASEPNCLGPALEEASSLAASQQQLSPAAADVSLQKANPCEQAPETFPKAASSLSESAGSACLPESAPSLRDECTQDLQRMLIPPLPIGGSARNAGRFSHQADDRERASPTLPGIEHAADHEPFTPVSDHGSGRRQLQVRHVHVSQLQADNTLGLLLNGTTIVGFRIPEARDTGWCVGDQIVDVAGHCVGTFEEFMERFQEARLKHGFPVVFNVLRHEDQSPDAEATAEDTLQNFFNNTDFANLTSQLSEKWHDSSPVADDRRISDFTANNSGRQAPTTADGSYCSSRAPLSAVSHGSSRAPENPFTTHDPSCGFSSEHPFVTALKLRRDALLRSSAGWAKYADDDAADTCESVASRLAKRHDGVSTLHVSRRDEKKDDRLPACSESPASWFCSGDSGSRAVDYELAPTPRVENYPSDTRWGLEVDPPWLATVTASKVMASRGEEQPLPFGDAGSSARVVSAPVRADSAEGDDFNIMVPRRNSRNGACKGTVEAKVQALLLGTSLPSQT